MAATLLLMSCGNEVAGVYVHVVKNAHNPLDRLELKPDGTWLYTYNEARADIPPGRGRYTVLGNRIDLEPELWGGWKGTISDGLIRFDNGKVFRKV
jgi:hypothetical protein